MIKQIMKFIIPLIIFSCTILTDELKLDQLESDKIVTFSSNFRGNYQDSIKLNIGLKFKMSNYLKYDFITINYKENNILQMDITNYRLVNNDYKSLFPVPFKPNENIDKSTFFYLQNRNIRISNSKAQKIVSKYNIEFDKWGERFRDTIQVTNYQQLKKDFPEIFDELNAVGDSLIITTSEVNNKKFRKIFLPIKW